MKPTFNPTMKPMNTPSPIHDIVIVTATDKIRPWTSLIYSNHKSFCDLYGMDYYHLTVAHPLMEGTEPQWSKIIWIQEMFRKHNYKIVIWIDDDVVLTNFRDNFFLPLLHRMNDNQKHVLLVFDAGDDTSKLNTGIMIFKNTLFTQMLLEKIWKKRKQGNLGTCKFQSCLHEQEALNQLYEQENSIREHILVLLPRENLYNLNTFYRHSHYDERRKMSVDYEKDPVQFRWKKGDNTCHCTGMTEKLRLKAISECIQMVDL
jgi:phenylpropionate dioxygenase-like ring-hydroxylating dioxygenase large terminal subunit